MQATVVSFRNSDKLRFRTGSFTGLPEKIARFWHGSTYRTFVKSARALWHQYIPVCLSVYEREREAFSPLQKMGFRIRRDSHRKSGEDRFTFYQSGVGSTWFGVWRGDALH